MNSWPLTLWTSPTYLILCSFPSLPLCPLFPHSQCSGIIITLNTYPVFTRLDVFYTRCAFCGAPVSNEKFYFSKSNSNSPFLGILPSLASRATLARPELPQPCGHVALTPLRSILHVVFMSAPPAVSEHIKADPCQVPGLYSQRGHGSASGEVPSHVYWLNEWNYWLCIKGPFCNFRNLCPFFSPSLFSLWYSLNPCMYSEV